MMNLTNNISHDILNITNTSVNKDYGGNNNEQNIYTNPGFFFLCMLAFIFGCAILYTINVMCCNKTCKRDICSIFKSSVQTSPREIYYEDNGNASSSEEEEDYYMYSVRNTNRVNNTQFSYSSRYSNYEDTDDESVEESSNSKEIITTTVIQSFSNINNYPMFCTICQDNKLNTIKTNCEHHFCEECIEKHLTNNNICPNCNQKITGLYKISFVKDFNLII